MIRRTAPLFATFALILGCADGAQIADGESVSASADAVPGSAGEAPVLDQVTFSSGDWELHGDWRVPGQPCRYPAALLLHRAAGTRAEHEGLAAELIARGVASLALDLRGHGESVNLGRFEEPYSDNLHINEETHLDVAAALDWLGARPDVDADRLAALGASYSGERVGRAFREGANARAYVMVSPGDFSQESIDAIAENDARWLFVRTEEESPNAKQYVDAIHDELAVTAPSAETLVYPGAGHATRIFESHPESVTDIADWIATALEADADSC